MLNSKPFLAIDFGAGTLKLAEFNQNEAGGLVVAQYGIKALGVEGAQEATREATILKALQEALAEKNFGTREINACAPGYHVFSRFIKLPPVDAAKVTQIIRYEAQQNVPFPLEEVVWDYQILGTSASNELEVLLVAIKSEIVEGLFRVAEGAGLRINLVDVSQAALCNAFRYNYGDLEECAMLLDIGAKTSNVLFFDKGKVYSRSITIGANSITQDFANEARLNFDQAEAIKFEKGFVSLGGAYEEPEDPQAAAISKIARQVMTRLHLQINQTIQFYRSQGGSSPQRMFLSGGASIMPYTAQFFAEKLNVQVDYFNPFRNIEIAQGVDLDELSKHAHSFGEVVGLGLRELAHCPVEMNLMPRSSIRRQELSRKKPYFAATIFGLVILLFAIGYAESRMANVYRNATDKIKTEMAPLYQHDKELSKVLVERDSLKKQAENFASQVEYRDYWADVLMTLKKALVQAELKTKESLKNNNVDVDVGAWIEAFSPGLPSGRYAVQGQTYAGLGNFSVGGGAGAPVTNERMMRQITQIGLRIRAVDRDKVAPNVNADLAYAVQEELKNSGLFVDPIKFGDIQKIEQNGTFVFTVSLKLKRPFRL